MKTVNRTDFDATIDRAIDAALSLTDDAGQLLGDLGDEAACARLAELAEEAERILTDARARRTGAATPAVCASCGELDILDSTWRCPSCAARIAELEGTCDGCPEPETEAEPYWVLDHPNVGTWAPAMYCASCAETARVDFAYCIPDGLTTALALQFSERLAEDADERGDERLFNVWASVAIHLRSLDEAPSRAADLRRIACVGSLPEMRDALRLPLR